MPNSPINYYNRYTKKIEQEIVYGETYLKWLYGTKNGKLFMKLFFKNPWFSRWYGRRMDNPKSKAMIQPFIEKYGVNMEEFLDKVENFHTFNEFFYRKLKKEVRPINTSQDTVVFPADGRHLGFENISKIDGIFVKGQKFDLKSFLNSSDEAEYFKEGTVVLSRLCPVDYHHFHFPVTGVPGIPVNIDGPLYSVSPFALRRRLEIFYENRRMLTKITSKQFGRILMMEVGATCCGSIIQAFTVNEPVLKGQEKGYFRFGGSSVITIYEKDRVQLAKDLIEQTKKGIELYAHVGDVLGTLRK